MAGVYLQPLQWNSQCITFSEWSSLLTLCLAPLIAHILSGTPHVSYLSHSRPKWYDYLCHYNPTSILWRYAAITDRRIRALQWSPSDMAASNAIFWTSEGWNGSERFVSQATVHCIQTPKHARVRILSVTMLKTLIITAQGVAALYTLAGSLAGTVSFNAAMGLDSIFFPLAILGLLRLCGAAWLTDDFAYMFREDIQMRPLSARPSVMTKEQETVLLSSDCTFEPLIGDTSSESHFRSVTYWPSRIFRFLYLLALAGVWTINLFYMAPITSRTGFTVTSFYVGAFFLLFLTGSIATYAYYFIRGSTNTTIIPCLSSKWYCAYCALMLAASVGLIVIAGIETNRTPQGRFTSESLGLQNTQCASNAVAWRVGPDSIVFAFLSSQPLQLPTTTTGTNTTWDSTILNNTFATPAWSYNFTGWCVAIPE
ncbi:putative SUR7/PalI family-domain-containing protein [Seiridium cardinale]